MTDMQRMFRGGHLPVTEANGLGEHQIVVQGLLHQVLLELALALHIVYDGLEALLAQRTLCLDLAPLQEAVETELMEARVRETLVLVRAQADGAAGRRRP